MVVRTLLVACACLVACRPGGARADGPGDARAGVPIVLGDEGTVDGDPAAPDVDVADPGAHAPEAVILVEEALSGDESHWHPEALPGCTCPSSNPGRTAYATADVLFLERANSAGPLAVVGPFGGNAGAPVITAGDVRYPTFAGLRLFQGWRTCEDWGCEVGYLGAWGMHADALATAPDGSLALPGQLGLVAGSGFDAATAIRPVTDAVLNSVELNLFSSRIHDGCHRHDPLPWRRSWDALRGSTMTADWILGIRWAGLDEAATLDVTALTSTPPPVFRTTGYRVTSSSHLVGPQIGHRRRVEWGDWALEGWAKAALAASFLAQSQGSVVGPFDLVEIREPRSGSRTGVGMIGDLNLAVVRRFGDHVGLRAGYSLLWFSGVAPAANQWDFTNTASSGTSVVIDTVFLHGATLGLEATW